MPDFERRTDEVREGDPPVVTDWTKLPFPESWKEFEEGVDRWLNTTWGPDWRCPHCGNRFWILAEPVALEAASAWPGIRGENRGFYPTVPIACSRCNQVTPVLLTRIFERPPNYVPTD